MIELPAEVFLMLMSVIVSPFFALRLVLPLSPYQCDIA
jgi:hypothetical protein